MDPRWDLRVKLVCIFYIWLLYKRKRIGICDILDLKIYKGKIVMKIFILLFILVFFYF